MNGDRITGIINEPYNPEKEPVMKSGARQLPNTGIERTIKVIIITAIVISILVAFFVIIPQIVLFFDPYSNILNKYWQINVQTSQIKTVKYLYYCKVFDKTEHTIISKTLKNKKYAFAKGDPWRTTGIESYSYFKPVRSSCRFRFAG